MSILSQQDIRTEYDAAPAEADDTDLAAKWQANLQGRAYPNSVQGASQGWAGYTYYPKDLVKIVSNGVSVVTSEPQGPRGRYIQIGIHGQYGPAGFGRAGNADTDQANPASLLGAFAHMIGRGDGWGSAINHKRNQRMELTFTSGSQMKSLWLDDQAVGQSPVASGGTFSGYEAGDTYEYGAIASPNDPTYEAQVTKTDDITTGIRSIPGMKGPD